MRAIAILLALGALAAGCRWPAKRPAIRVYEGDKRPEGEVAVIMRGVREPPYWPGARREPYTARVFEIDGRWFTLHYATDAYVTDGDRFEVLPGVHTIRIIALPEPDWYFGGVMPFTNTPVDLQLRAEAGHVYEAGAAWPGFGLPAWIWIFDQDSGEVVAGARPQERDSEQSLPRKEESLARRDGSLSDPSAPVAYSS